MNQTKSNVYKSDKNNLNNQYYESGYESDPENIKNKKKFPATMAKTKERIIVTAALPYANGDIHIGHLLEYIQADIFARFLKLVGKDALYICASDMHGTPIEINAGKAGKKPEQFALEFWKEHQKDFASYLISFDNYWKTHSPENKELSEHFFSTLKEKGHIYTKSIKTIYCENCRRSLPDRYVKGKCPNCNAEDQYGDICEKCNSALKGVNLLEPYCSICGKEPKLRDSEHYFFRLSNFTDRLRRWINSKDSWIQPEVKNWLKEWFDKGLEDWCVSRDGPYFGFEVPDSRKETGEIKFFYVWLDAPIGYIASTKNYCDKLRENKESGESKSNEKRIEKRNEKNDEGKGNMHWEDYWKEGQVYHIIGKDIAYFHYLFWPAMLDGVGIPLPKLTTHGFITVDGQKMSKSRGTFFTGKDFLKLYPAEALRFYYALHLDRKVVDINLNFAEFTAVNNNVLVGSLGNFCYRVLTFAEKNYGEIRAVSREDALNKKIEALVEKAKKSYLQQDFSKAVKCIMQAADTGNSYFQKAEPWKNKENEIVRKAVGWCVNLARNLSILIQPVLPEFSSKVWSALGEKKLSWEDIGFSWKGKLEKVKLLVEKIELTEKVEKDEEKAARKEESKKRGNADETSVFPLQMKVGKIIDVRKHPNADSLYVLKVDFGSEERQVVAGLKKCFSPENLLGRKTVFCTNLEPAELRGEVSEAMILVAEAGKDKYVLLDAGKAEPGEEISFGKQKSSGKKISFKEFLKLKITVQAGNVFCNGRKLVSSHGEVLVKGVADGTKVC